MDITTNEPATGVSRVWDPRRLLSAEDHGVASAALSMSIAHRLSLRRPPRQSAWALRVVTIPCGDAGGNFYAMALCLGCRRSAVHSYDKKMSSIYCRTFCLWGGITFATQRQQSDCPWRSTHHLGRLLSAMRRQAHLGTRKARHGGLVMPCALGLVIALGMGFLAIGVVPWTARCTGATLWPYLRRVRLRTSGAGRPIVRAVGTWADGSPSEEQGHTGQPWHRAHRLRGRFASRPTPCEEGVWEVRTFVCYIPRRSVEERQRLLAAWRDSQHAGAGPVHVHY